MPEARSKKPLGSRELKDKGAVLYVGETSRSIQERCKEHWASYTGEKEESHMLKHQWLEHGGEQADFVMRVVGSKRTALVRQISEAVRIRRRGEEGRILNSRSEFNRSHIPRLQVEEEEKIKKREEEIEKEDVLMNKILESEELQWEQTKLKKIGKDRQELLKQLRSNNNSSKKNKEGGAKRSNEDKKKGRRSKKRRYALLGEDWGAVSCAPSGVECEGAEVEGGGELLIPPSSPGRKPVEVGVVTPRQITQIRLEGPLTQRRIFEYLTPTRPRAENSTAHLPSGKGEERMSLEMLEIGSSVVAPEGEGREGVKKMCQAVVLSGKSVRKSQNPDDEEPLTTPSVGHTGILALNESFLLPTQTPNNEMKLDNRWQEGSFHVEGLNCVKGDTKMNGGGTDTNVISEHNEICVQKGNTDDTTGLGDDNNGGPDSSDNRWRYDQVENYVENDDLMSTSMSRGDDAMQTDGNDDAEMSGGDASMNKKPCTMNKRGYCIEHKIKGDRSEIKYKAWRKKKYGYGYVTCKKVMFSCPSDEMHHSANTQVNNQISEPASSNEGDFNSGCDNVQWGSAGGIRGLQDKAVLKVKGPEKEPRQGDDKTS